LIGSLRPFAALRLLGFWFWSCQFLSGSQRILALHHRNPAEADRRWRGRATVFSVKWFAMVCCL
jgi:hypothetical protein